MHRRSADLPHHAINITNHVCSINQGGLHIGHIRHGSRAGHIARLLLILQTTLKPRHCTIPKLRRLLTLCTGLNQPVFAMTEGDTCYCGDTLPAANTMTDDSECNVPCNSYPDEMCGGSSAFSVYTNGLDSDPPVLGGSSGGSSTSADAEPSTTATPTSTSTSSTTSQTRTRTGRPKATVVTSVNEGTTVYVTNTPTPSSSAPADSNSDSDSGGGTSVGAIAGGVVVGVVVLIAVVVGIWFFLRRRKQKTSEEEYKRTQVADFMRGGERKPPNTGYSHSSDSRLDPEAGARRNSQGSIADAGDYSRRILRVANPDNS